MFALDLASVGGWLNPKQISGNASVRRDQRSEPPPVPFGDYLPAVFDLETGRIHPIPRPFLDLPPLYGRNHIQAVVQGPFARVVGTESCLHVRAEPGLAARVLACVADGVLLKDTGQHRELGGETWLRVITPGGIEGWASTAYLER